MKKHVLLLLLLALLASLNAVDLTLIIDASRWQDRALYPVSTEDVGAPSVPYYPVKVLVPFGHSVSAVNVVLGEASPLRSGIELDYIRQPQPVSLPTADTTIRREELYRSRSAYPAKNYDYLGTQFYRGAQLAIINIYPFKYIGSGAQVLAHNSVTVQVETAPDPALADYQSRMFSLQNQETHLSEMVLNPAALASYRGISHPGSQIPSGRLIDLSIPYKMIIITDATRLGWFAEYASWRTSKGVSTGIFSTQDIYSSYGGVDNADKVRNFIIDAYQTWAGGSTNLEYVIMGGDDEVAPERSAYGRVGSTIDPRMPVDLYYGCLDGTWNGNNNQVWGETSDNVDMTPELHVGRFPAESLTEFNNIFRKIRYYVDTDSFSNNIATMFGENLNNNPLTWGGDYKDDVAQYIPDTYYLQTHYQRDGTYSESIVWNAINQGVNVMNHMGHANETFLLGQGNNTIEQLQNTEYGFLYSQGCYPAAFDQRTSGDGESIGEHLLTAYGAVMGFIGNTRYGWYMPGGIDGASQFYDRQYFIALYNQGILELGKALTYSRLQNLNSALTSDVMRWCYYEQVLFGDPSITVKFPDLSLPLLSLDSYSFSDVEGDNDGNIAPGELIRFYPVIQNHPEWGPAHNVSVQITGLPVGAQILSGCPVYENLSPGSTTPAGNYVRIQLPQNIGYGNYTFKVALSATHPQTGLSVGTRVFEASFSITLMDSRFPWDCQIGSKSAPVVHPFNAESGLDIAYLDSYGRTWMIDNEGSSYLDFAPAEPQNIMRSTAMGFLDNDAEPDMVIASRTGAVYAVEASGSTVMNFTAPTTFLYSPVLADFNADGRHETILGGLDGKIYVISPEGTLLPGFPVELSSTFNSELAVASFDNGQSLDIIAGCVNGDLYRISASGQILPGFPVNLGSSITGSPGVMNGKIYAGTNTQIHKIMPDASLSASAPITASMAGGAVFGDIIYNSKLDLAFVTIGGILYAMDEDLALLPGFPVNLGENFSCPPLLADLAGDGRPEIVLHSYINSVHVRQHNGDSLAGFPFTTSYNGATPGTLVDFDGNGYYKLISGYSTGVMVVNLHLPVGGPAQWSTYRGSLLRQGSLESTGFVSNADSAAPGLVFGLLQNYPNPFSGSTTIDYKLSQPGRVSLEIYNLRGQLVRSLVNEAKSVGIHSTNWDGRDASGRSIASGVYLYRLTSPEGSQTRRLLIVK